MKLASSNIDTNDYFGTIEFKFALTKCVPNFMTAYNCASSTYITGWTFLGNS